MNQSSRTSLPQLVPPGARQTNNPSLASLPPLAPAPPEHKKNETPSLRTSHATFVDPALPAAGQSRLKLPKLVKPLQLRPIAPQTSVAAPSGNQEEDTTTNKVNGSKHNNDDEEDKRTRSGSSRSNTSSTNSSHASSSTESAAHSKNRDYIKELEDKKRKEREAREKQERRQRKLHEKNTHKLLQEAASKKQTAVATGPEEDDIASNEASNAAVCDATGEQQQQQGEEGETQEDEAVRERKKDKARRQKKLLQKQQQLLETLQAKKREKEEEAEQERERERRRKEKVTRAILSAIQDANQSREANAVPENDTSDDAEDEDQQIVQDGDVDTSSVNDCAVNEEQKRKVKEKQDAMKRKQQEYLTKLADQRKQKQQEDEEARALQERRKKKTQKEAALRLQEAAKQQQEAALLKEQEEAAAAAREKEKPAATVNVDAMIARLSKLKERDVQVMPEARDFASWKKRNGVRPEQKVFSLTGTYPVIREELEKRGWAFNADRTSPFFDLKWSLKSDDLKGNKLEKHQYVNHFFQNTAITTKVGLLHNLRRGVWHQSVDGDALFPRAFDLNDPRDMDGFIQEFRYGVAEGLLKQLVGRILQGHQNISLNQGVLDVVLTIARKKLKRQRPHCDVDDDGLPLCVPDELEDSLDNPLATGGEELVTDIEWEVLTKCSVDKPGSLRASLVYTRKVVAEDKSGEQLPGLEGGSAAMMPAVDTVMSAREKQLAKQLERQLASAFAREKTRIQALLAHVKPLTSTQRSDAERLTRSLAALCPQFHLNGGADVLSEDPKVAASAEPSLNVWIVKPAGLSRGRGIRVFNDMTELLGYADVANHKECQWVAQRYMENPLLVCRRKFDIRQWVLVTSWDPLTVWMHGDCYLRFSSEEYSMADLSDQYVHLTNNSIQKYSDKFHDKYGTEDGGTTVEGNMLHSDAFQGYLRDQLGRPDAWEDSIRPAMRRTIVHALQCVQDLVTHRNNSCELFGYDFMLDTTLRPWLIEINSSPACDYSTPTAERYVKEGLAGIVKVIVDHREFEESTRRNGRSGEAPPDTSPWRRIHKAELIGKPVAAFGADFQVKGEKVTRGKRKGPALSTNAVAARITVVEEQVKAEVANAIDEGDDADANDDVEEQSAPSDHDDLDGECDQDDGQNPEDEVGDGNDDSDGVAEDADEGDIDTIGDGGEEDCESVDSQL